MMCFIVVSAFGGGFNRWMQQIDKTVEPVFRSLVFFLVVHSIVLLQH